jgi:hypothetical protein
MKTYRLLLLSPLAALAAISTLFAADVATTPAPRTEVIFSHPEKFADVRDSYNATDKGRDGILDQLRDYLVQRANYYIPEGQKLTVTVTDVDMAGDFEPWRGPQMSDVRVVKDIYPPKIDLTYTVTGPSNQVIKEGKRQLRDLAFLMKASPVSRDDTLRYEKALIDDWFRSDFPRTKKS